MGVSIAVQQQPDHFGIVEIEHAGQRVCALGVSAMTQQQSQPISVAQFGRVIQAFAIVGISGHADKSMCPA